MATHWHSESDAAGITWLHLDVAGSGANVLSATVLDELDESLKMVAAARPKGVVFVSDKSSGFIAGADVREFQGIRMREDALIIVRNGQKVMSHIESLPCPTVAAINRFCLGGGLELALACNYRVALDGSATRLGLPEIKLGIHPGFGGTLRAVRLLGPLAAMDMMLTGKTLDVRQSLKLGLIDHAVPARHLFDAARTLIDKKPIPHRPSRLLRVLNSTPARPILARQMRRRVAVKARPEHYPAPYALIDLWRRYTGDDNTMLAREAESVADLSVTGTARNLVRVFMLQNRLKALGDKRLFHPRHVHVIGGGTMGGDIAAWTALQGLRVTVQDQNADNLAKTMKRAHGLFAKRFKNPRQITETLDRLIPDHKGLGLKRADVVIEAIFEDLDAKRALYRNIEPLIKPGALLATNTSSLAIEPLANVLSDPGRLIGLHFFNPVAHMPLIKVIRGPQSHPDRIANALAFARHIDKLPLETASSPGLLVNRVLTPYLLEAMSMVDEGIPIAATDRAAMEFGMLMGPVEMIDIVGLDVVLSVSEILAPAHCFEMPAILRDLVAAGRLGRKSGQGFYAYRDDKPVRDKELRHTAGSQALQLRLVQKLINEAAACLRDGVVKDADLLDAGIIFGAGFAPFRGGPLHYRAVLDRDLVPAQITSTKERHET